MIWYGFNYFLWDLLQYTKLGKSDTIVVMIIFYVRLIFSKTLVQCCSIFGWANYEKALLSRYILNQLEERDIGTMEKIFVSLKFITINI